MKNLFVALLTILSFSSSAQTDAEKQEKQYIPTAGYFGVTMNVSGIINNIGLTAVKDPVGSDLILGKYYGTNRIVYRVGLGINTVSYTSTFTDSLGSGQINMDSTFSQAGAYISPGFEFHFLDDKRLDPYVGGAMSLGFIGKSKYSTTSEFIDTTGTNKNEITYQKDGGFVFGATALVGFNYYIARNLSLGAEYQLGIYHTREGGDWERVTVNTPVSGSSTSSREVGAERSAATTVGLSSNLNLTLSYFFNIRN